MRDTKAAVHVTPPLSERRLDRQWERISSRLDKRRRNEAQRFHILIDTLYEARTLLIASAEVPPDEIYTEGDGSWEFQRTESRLHEMQSEDYVANVIIAAS